MTAIPFELMAAHMVFDDSDERAVPAPARRLNPTRYVSRSAAREEQRRLVRQRLISGWSVLNPDVARAIRHGR